MIAMINAAMYSKALARIHDSHFGEVARRAAPNIVRILERAQLSHGAVVVEVGCGSGILARYLTDRGYCVTGVDCSAAMIRLARAKAPLAHFRVASLATARIPRCDAVVGVGEVIGYVDGGLPALRSFVDRVRRALNPGGLLIFDFMESAAGRTYPTKTFQGDDWTIAVTAGFDRQTKILTRRIAIVSRFGRHPLPSTETHRIRIYPRRQILELLEDCGFSVEVRRSYGRYRLMRGDVAVVARKPRI